MESPGRIRRHTSQLSRVSLNCVGLNRVNLNGVNLKRVRLAEQAVSIRRDAMATLARPRIRKLSEMELDRYTLVPRWVARRAILVQVPVLPPGAVGMTSGRMIFLRRNEPTDGRSTLIAHELIHVRQFTEMGRLYFLIRYLGGYLRNLLTLRNHHSAYLAIPQEREAYASAAAWHHAQR